MQNRHLSFRIELAFRASGTRTTILSISRSSPLDAEKPETKERPITTTTRVQRALTLPTMSTAPSQAPKTQKLAKWYPAHDEQVPKKVGSLFS